MAVVPVIPVLFIAFVTTSHCEQINGYNYNNGNDVSRFGEILKPPPPPLLPIFPVPFHGGAGRIRQNSNNGYQYQPSLPPQAPPITPSGDFKFPAPFYKQYNFNFVPPPQPFSTTPSPSLFQKVSGWLFPSQQVASDSGAEISYNIAPLKKDCNPCNLVPWIPVIRYDLASNNGRQNLNPTYGPPSPTTNTNFNTAQNVAQSFKHYSNIPTSNQVPGIPHSVYGPPISLTNNDHFKFQSSTYGPPSPTHTVTISNDTPYNTQYSSGSNYEIPNTSIGPISNYGLPSSPQSASSSKHNFAPSTYMTSSAYNQFSSTTHNPVSLNYNNNVLNHNIPSQNNINNKPPTELQLPKVSYPTNFRNSYGEPIIDTYALDIPYSVSAPAASTKIKTQVLPDNKEKILRPNITVALANPAPFSFNRGRNIHTLQPVALPNLSVSPLPPIFNARPFRTIPKDYPSNILHGINHLQVNNVNIAKSVPIAEYTHSIDYPTTVIQSPVIDIDELKKTNQTKAYRNIPSSYEIDEIPQASEDHVSAAKSNQDASFENINTGLTNDLYDSIPLDLKQTVNAPFNHKMNFADLRGVKDEDVDKYRTESNLQHIDSPLLYLKPSAPHKNYQNFMYITSTPRKSYEFEIYDDYTPTTSSTTQTERNFEENNKKQFESSYRKTTEDDNNNRPKIVQIIVPYTTDQRVDNSKTDDVSVQQDLISNVEQEYQARKIQSHTESNYYSFATESISSIMTTTEDPIASTTESYETERTNEPTVQNHQYDVKEPPFDIIKLQHTIDDWTEQEYSKHYHIPRRTRPNEKYAKQIPDEYLTTISPITSFTTDNSYNYDIYDHEGSSSIQHSVIENLTNDFPVNRKEYNVIQRNKTKNNIGKNEESESNKKLHIYTAASTFRTTTTTTTTPAPWGQIQTSISPLTNEKVYVVTSKPWKDKNGTSDYEYEINEYNSKRTDLDDSSELDEFPLKSLRFSNRPPYGFTADSIEPTKFDSPYGFQKSLYRKINNLQNVAFLSNQNVYYEEDKAREKRSQSLKRKTAKVGFISSCGGRTKCITKPKSTKGPGP